MSTTSELSATNMVVITKIGDYWVNEIAAERIKGLIEDGSKGMVNLDGSLITISSIQGILTPAAYDIVNNKRRFAWQCKYKHWHEKSEKCNHGNLPQSMLSTKRS